MECLHFCEKCKKPILQINEIIKENKYYHKKCLNPEDINNKKEEKDHSNFAVERRLTMDLKSKYSKGYLGKTLMTEVVRPYYQFKCKLEKSKYLELIPTKDKISIEIPAGYIEKGENSIDAAKRELLEETGYTTDNIIMVDSYYPSFGISGERIDLFLAIGCEKVSDLNLDPDEYIVNELVSLDEFKYLVDNNYIKGANERLGYYHYLDYLKGE